MSYALLWSPKSRKNLAKLDKKTVVRIIEKMRSVAESHYGFLEKIKDEEGYKVRVGDYRIFVDLDKEKHEVHVLTVRHRKKAYKKK